MTNTKDAIIDQNVKELWERTYPQGETVAYYATAFCDGARSAIKAGLCGGRACIGYTIHQETETGVSAHREEGGTVTDEELVKAQWSDAKLFKAFAVQPDKTRRWMWCAMSKLKFIASRGKKKRVLNIGSWRFSEADAWADAAS